MKEYLEIEDWYNLPQLFGPLDKNIRMLEKSLGVSIYWDSNKICLEGSRRRLAPAKKLIEDMMKSSNVRPQDEIHSQTGSLPSLGGIKIWAGRLPIAPRTLNQQRYIDAIKRRDLVFVIGPAGSGKTYLAMAMAINFLQNKVVRKIILTRPAIEAGESLGYLPGGIQQKLNPYLRPLYDALYDILKEEVAEDYLKKGIIEVAPLGYMRGRTLSNAFIIMDEAQNCTRQQLKMFLTRFGQGSKVVVTGDITQTDLPQKRPWGFIHTLRLLRGIEGIEFVYLNSQDIVRHKLVKKIAEAYEKYCRRENT